jgi:hypothetical protein
MAEAPALVTARSAVSELLQRLGIDRVVCVDDIYARKWTIDDVQAAQLDLPAEELIAVLPEIGENIPDDRDVRRERFRQTWTNLDAAAQEDRAQKILGSARTKHAGGQDDPGDASILQEIIGAERLLQLAPDDWTNQEAQLLGTAAQGRLLVLFDQDLSQAGGSATGGMALVKNVLAKDASGSLLCGLLTHTATPQNQYEKWQEYAGGSEVDPDRFVVVPKGWLSQDPVGFARMLKLVALSPDCKRLKGRIKDIIDSVTTDAAKEIDAISVFDFDHVVFRACHKEGLWEPEMLFRLHGIFHRTTVRTKAHQDAELGEMLKRLRHVSLIPTDSDAAPAPTSWRLQQREMYESAEYVNGLHLPIDVGDIFEKTEGGSTKAFLLLGQPCDLMVRSDGKRAPDIADVTLVEIAAADAPKPYSELLPYYGKDTGVKHYVLFRRVHFVDPCVLDLCVFNTDGAAKIDASGACPAGLMPAWEQRYEVLRKRADGLLRRYEKFAEGKLTDKGMLDTVRSELIKAFPPPIGNSGIFKASIALSAGSRTISFNCKRVQRLYRPRALALVLQYAACVSRPAFDRDLGL